MSQGKTTEQLQQMLLSMDPGQAEAFLSNIKGFVITFVLGLIVILVGGLLLYSLSRKLIWDYLLEKKFNKKTYWRWNLLNLALIIPLLIYFFAFGLVRLILGYLVSLFKSQVVSAVFYDLVNLFFLFILVIFVFLVYYFFTEKYKVWESIGSAFNLIKTKWKDIQPMFLLIVGTAVVLSVVLWPIGKLFAYQQGVLIGINIVVSLLFIAWMRIYVLRSIKG
ncbi:unnamed protein product [marine sediment metagenome]|uniref:Glycerophosphoryl diester phosphodiesterase membrane domain-containing protein n=1 Tax=marine sediment metagenome TaxID=412755 RepID=X0STS3_9ZZZZ